MRAKTNGVIEISCEHCMRNTVLEFRVIEQRNAKIVKARAKKIIGKVDDSLLLQVKNLLATGEAGIKFLSGHEDGDFIGFVDKHSNSKMCYLEPDKVLNILNKNKTIGLVTRKELIQHFLLMRELSKLGTAGGGSNLVKKYRGKSIRVWCFTREELGITATSCSANEEDNST